MLFYNQVKGFGDSENMICRRGKQELAEEQQARYLKSNKKEIGCYCVTLVEHRAKEAVSKAVIDLLSDFPEHTHQVQGKYIIILFC